ncbi:MAG: family 1 encapsulin nanocompartment shell protein, partial [Halanaerobiaceae bacterium]
MTLLKRHLAPIEKGVWDFIDEEARDVLKQKLNGRMLVDTLGPKGRSFAAYNTGRNLDLDLGDGEAKYSLRNVLPLLEVEVPFSLSLDEIESYLRGAKDADIDNLVEASKKIAKIENNAIYYGIEEAAIKGLVDESDHVRININDDTGLLTPLTSAIQAFKLESVEGPYNFVVGPYLYGLLHKLDEKGYPLKRKIKD